MARRPDSDHDADGGRHPQRRDDVLLVVGFSHQLDGFDDELAHVEPVGGRAHHDEGELNVGTLPWYVARSSGIVAWVLVLATILWGLLLATRTKVLGHRPTPAWTLSLHRYLGALTVAFVAVHVGAVLLDGYTTFGITDVLVPFTGSWHPAAVAWGIVGMYLLAAVEITSLLRHRLSKRSWRAVHLLSYFLFASTTVHMLTAGTDVKALVASTAAALLGVAAVFGASALYVWRSDTGAGRAVGSSARLPSA